MKSFSTIITGIFTESASCQNTNHFCLVLCIEAYPSNVCKAANFSALARFSVTLGELWSTCSSLTPPYQQYWTRCGHIVDWSSFGLVCYEWMYRYDNTQAVTGFVSNFHLKISWLSVGRRCLSVVGAQCRVYFFFLSVTNIEMNENSYCLVTGEKGSQLFGWMNWFMLKYRLR